MNCEIKKFKSHKSGDKTQKKIFESRKVSWENISKNKSKVSTMAKAFLITAVCIVTSTIFTIAASSGMSGNHRCNGTDVNNCIPACVSYRLDIFGCPTCDCVFDIDKFEGDIKLTPKILINVLHRLNVARGATNYTLVNKEYQLQKWNKTKSGKFFLVPYVFDYSLSGAAFRAILRAIEAFNIHTCVRFISRTVEKDFLNFTDASGCWSYIGRNGGSQEVSISSGCEYVGTVIHQLMHSLGFWHEQSRIDRDRYVYVLGQNIKRGYDGSFQKQTSDNIGNISSPYDYQSIMHFDQYAFSKDQNKWITLIKANGDFYEKYNLNYFSALDANQINRLYHCPDFINSTKPETGNSTANGTTNSKTKSLPQEPCKDDDKDCAERKENGECTGSPVEKAMMQLVCKATCGFCKKAIKPPAADCKDVGTNCAKRKENGDCDGPMRTKLLMQEDCKATCGICKKETKPAVTDCKDVGTNCAKRKEKGDCDGPMRTKLLMQEDCKATCGICKKDPVTKPAVECKDTGKNCLLRKKNGECDGPSVKKAMMSLQCKATCGLCDKTNTTKSKTDIKTTSPKNKSKSPGKRRRRRCSDSVGNCRMRAMRGDCDGSWKRTQKMQRDCKRTCGFCSSGSGCRDIRGKFCSKNRCHKISVRRNCPRTCNACSVAQEQNSLKSFLGMFYMAFNGLSDQFVNIF